MKSIDTLRCESFLALTSESKLFIDSASKILTYGKRMYDSLSSIDKDFANFGCMDSYWRWVTTPRLKKDFYFGFSLQPDWVENVVDEFNSRFKNFSIEIVWKKDWNISAEKEWSFFTFFYTNDPKNIHSKAGGYIYKLNCHIEIKPKTKEKILYTFHHFLRSISVPEKIFWFSDIPPHTNYIEYVLSKNNDAKSGRSLTDYFVTEDDFLALDDEKVLEIFDDIVYDGILKQSDTLYITGQIKRHGREYFDEIPWEIGGLPNHPRTLYGIFLSDGGYVYIRKKPSSGKLLYNSHYYMNPGIIFHAKIHVNFSQSALTLLNQNKCYSEGGLQNYQLFPLVDIYNRYPELDEEIVPKLVKLVNENLEANFKTPRKKDFIME